jgi:hypothetical protein
MVCVSERRGYVERSIGAAIAAAPRLRRLEL